MCCVVLCFVGFLLWILRSLEQVHFVEIINQKKKIKIVRRQNAKIVIIERHATKGADRKERRANQRQRQIKKQHAQINSMSKLLLYTVYK